MTDHKSEKSTKHKTSSRTEELPGGTIGAWYTADDEEIYLGAFRDERTAEYELANAIDTVEARWAAEPDEPEAAPKAKAPTKEK